MHHTPLYGLLRVGANLTAQLRRNPIPLTLRRQPWKHECYTRPGLLEPSYEFKASRDRAALARSRLTPAPD